MMSEVEGKTTLFTLRIWAVPLERAQVEWRGKLQALPDGEAYFFRGWPELITRLEALLGSGGYSVDSSLTEGIGE
jgi:hypothetical protein